MEEHEVISLAARGKTWWCLCPNSNLYIENRLPPIDLLRSYDVPIVLGTDSLASNTSLNILEEIKTIESSYPGIELEEIITWACKNGAEALDKPHLGTIEKGKTPGLVLIENCDLENLSLKPESRSLRLI